MENKLMKEFVVLAETCSFQETAENLFISQSSLSKHISKIEEELGVILFDRTTRTVTLNQYGIVFYEYARQIVQLTEEYTKALNEISTNDNCKISIGFPPMCTQYGIIEILSAFCRNYPHISLNMIESNHPEEALHSKQCDFVCTTRYTPFSKNDAVVKSQLFMEDHMVVLLPINHPLAKESKISIQQLQNEKFVMHGELPGSMYLDSRNVYKLCVSNGFEPDVIMTTSFTSTIVRLVSQGTGIAVVNGMQSPLPNQNPNVVVIDMYPRIPFYIYVLHLKNNKNAPAHSDFIRYIASHHNNHT